LLVFLGLWTWKLLEPNPVPEALSEHLKGDVRFAAAKSLHACGYGFLTLLAVTLPVPNYWRWFFAGLLALHGVATEIGQTYVPGRTGSVRDVLIDWVGVGLALLVWRVVVWRTARRLSSVPAGTSCCAARDGQKPAEESW
jgi:VanZ family protein